MARTGTVLPSQNSATESGRCTARAASKGRSEISAGQMVRTRKSTDTPCTLSAAQHSVLAHSPGGLDRSRTLPAVWRAASPVVNPRLRKSSARKAVASFRHARGSSRPARAAERFSRWELGPRLHPARQQPPSRQQPPAAFTARKRSASALPRGRQSTARRTPGGQRRVLPADRRTARRAAGAAPASHRAARRPHFLRPRPWPGAAGRNTPATARPRSLPPAMRNGNSDTSTWPAALPQFSPVQAKRLR